MNTFVGVPPPVMRKIPPLIAELAGYTETELQWLQASDLADINRATKAVASL